MARVRLDGTAPRRITGGLTVKAWVNVLIGEGNTTDGVEILQQVLDFTWKLYVQGYEVGDLEWEKVCTIITTIQNSPDPAAHD